MNQKLSVTINNLQELYPLTTNQASVFHNFTKKDVIVLSGCAGTGKTLCALYKALEEVLDRRGKRQKIIIVRSNVSVRDPGALPGDLDEKNAVYELPYEHLCSFLLGKNDSYSRLKEQGIVTFMSTSFLRGITFNNSIVIIDEFENCNFQEIDTVITRLGNNSKLIMCGDIAQTDLLKKHDPSGWWRFMTILEGMNNVLHVNFTTDDIVRSGLVKDYLIAKDKIESCNT